LIRLFYFIFKNFLDGKTSADRCKTCFATVIIRELNWKSPADHSTHFLRQIACVYKQKQEMKIVTRRDLFETLNTQILRVTDFSIPVFCSVLFNWILELFFHLSWPESFQGFDYLRFIESVEVVVWPQYSMYMIL